MEITRSKLLALVIAIGYVAFAVYGSGDAAENALRCMIWLLFSLMLIWFPEELGSMKGYVGRGGYINRETPACMVSVMGWLFLVGLPLALWWFS